MIKAQETNPSLDLTKLDLDQLWPDLLDLTRFDWTWPDLTRLNQLWPDLTWPEMTRLDWLWPDLTRIDQTWLDLTRIDRTWPVFTRLDQTWPEFTGLDQSSPDLTGTCLTTVLASMRVTRLTHEDACKTVATDRICCINYRIWPLTTRTLQAGE